MDKLMFKYGIPQDSVHVQYKANFEAYELLAASRLAKDGHDVEILRANSKPGSHTPDYRVDGQPYEIKQLTVSSTGRLGKRICEASAQSRDVIIDMSLETLSYSEAVAKAKEALETPTYRYLGKYEKANNGSRGQKEVRVDSVTLIFHDRIETIRR